MVTCCKVTGTNTPTQKTHLVCVGDENSKMVAPRIICVAAKKEEYRVCVCCTVFDTTHPIGVVVVKLGLCWWF